MLPTRADAGSKREWMNVGEFDRFEGYINSEPGETNENPRDLCVFFYGTKI